MAEVASAYVSLLPSAKGFGKKLTSEVGGDVKSAGKKLGSGFGKVFAVAGGAFAAAGVASFLKDSVGGAADLEQSIGAIDTVFKDSAKQMKLWSEGAAQDVGLTRNEFNELGTLIGSQLKNGGTAMDELAPKTRDLITAGADLSSMFGGTTKEAVEALSSALKGERDPIERYGVSLNQAKIDAEAAALGFEKVDGALSSQAQQAATLSLITKQTADAQGNFAKESNTLAGQQQRLTAQWGDMKTSLGTKLLPVLTNFAEYINGTALPAISGLAGQAKDVAAVAWGKLQAGADALERMVGFDFTKIGLGDIIALAKTSWGKLQSGVDALQSLTTLDADAIGAKIGGAVRSALDSIVSLGKDAGAKIGEMFGKVDWVGLGIAMGKQVPALLVGLAAGILAFDLGSLLSGLADNWGTILIGVITIAFAPARVVGALAKILTKIPFVGPFIARGLTWFNEIGRSFAKRVTGFVGDLGRSFTRGFGSLKIPGAGLVKNVLGAFKAIPGRVSDFFDLLKTRIGVWALDAFEAMGKGARTAVGGALKFIGGIPGMILRSLGSLARTLSPRGFELIAGLLQAAKTRFVSVVTYIGAIPGRLLGALGDLGSLFYNKGAELISGLTRGISAKMTDAINAVKAGLDRIKGMLPGSPIKWGPLKNWNNGGAGKRLMDLVAKGITAATPKTVKAAQAAFEKIGDALKAERDKLRGTLDGLKGDFASLADSVSGAFTGDLFGVSAVEADAEAGIAGKTVGQSFVDNLLGKKSELTGLLSSFKTLKGWGIDPAFLSQLFASGNGALITELAGMGQAGATSAANLFGEVTSLGSQLGTAVAENDPVAARIDETNRLLTQVNKQLSYLGSDIGKELNAAAAKAQRDRKGKGKK